MQYKQENLPSNNTIQYKQENLLPDDIIQYKQKTELFKNTDIPSILNNSIQIPNSISLFNVYINNMQMQQNQSLLLTI